MRAEHYSRREFVTRSFLAGIGLTTSAYGFPRGNDKKTGAEYEPRWESLKKYRVPEWYQDAKFGVFIHWGVYAVPAFGSEWYFQ
jgi:hypothetical protein